MRKSTRLALLTLTATLLFGTAVSTASARVFNLSEQTFRTVWTSLEFTNEIGIATIRCAVTLEGNFHSRTIVKAVNALIGQVTAVRVRRPCVGGEAWAANGTEVLPNGRTYLSTLPWHIQYESFTGTLPNIRTIRIALSRFRFLISTGNVICAAEFGNATDRAPGDAQVEAGGAITNLVPVAGVRSATNVRTLAGICPARAGFQAPVTDGTTTILNSTARIVVTLI